MQNEIFDGQIAPFCQPNSSSNFKKWCRTLSKNRPHLLSDVHILNVLVLVTFWKSILEFEFPLKLYFVSFFGTSFRNQKSRTARNWMIYLWRRILIFIQLSAAEMFVSISWLKNYVCIIILYDMKKLQ